MLNYNSQEKKTYSDLINSKRLIKQNETYDFMNEIFCKDSASVDSLQFTKIICSSIGHSKELGKFINEISDTILSNSDKKFMKDQLIKTSLIWDKSKLKNFWVLAPSDLNKIDDSGNNDYWEEFRKLYGNYGRHKFSKPIFNKNFTVAIIEHIGQGDWLLGSGEIIVYIKINEKWTFYFEKNLWIS